MNTSPELNVLKCDTETQRTSAASGLEESVCRWDFSPEGDAVEDGEQDDAPGSERTIKHLFNGPQNLQV